jgi:hypothetical protein
MFRQVGGGSALSKEALAYSIDVSVYSLDFLSDLSPLDKIESSREPSFQAARQARERLQLLYFPSLLSPIKKGPTVEANVIAGIATAIGQGLQLPGWHFPQVIDIQVLLARVGKTEVA